VRPRQSAVASVRGVLISFREPLARATLDSITARFVAFIGDEIAIRAPALLEQGVCHARRFVVFSPDSQLTDRSADRGHPRGHGSFARIIESAKAGLVCRPQDTRAVFPEALLLKTSVAVQKSASLPRTSASNFPRQPNGRIPPKELRPPGRLIPWG
jgi:hypothetical protein